MSWLKSSYDRYPLLGQKLLQEWRHAKFRLANNGFWQRGWLPLTSFISHNLRLTERISEPIRGKRAWTTKKKRAIA